MTKAELRNLSPFSAAHLVSNPRAPWLPPPPSTQKSLVLAGTPPMGKLGWLPRIQDRAALAQQLHLLASLSQHARKAETLSSSQLRALMPTIEKRTKITRMSLGIDMPLGARLIILFSTQPWSRLSNTDLLRRTWTRERNRDFALHKAALQGDSDTVLKLLELGRELDTMDEKGCTPLQLAFHSGCSEVVGILLEAGASPNPPWTPPCSPADGWILAYRIMKSFFKVVLCAWIAHWLYIPVPTLIVRNLRRIMLFCIATMLLHVMAAFVSLYKTFPDYAIQSLAVSATSFRGESEHMILMLIDSGFEPCEEEKLRLWTHAAFRGYTGVCSRLLGMGWNVNAIIPDNEDDIAMTALLAAAKNSDKDLTMLLLSGAADPAATDSQGRSCLLLSCMQTLSSEQSPNDPDDILKILLDTEAAQFINTLHLSSEVETASSVFFSNIGWPLAEACYHSRAKAVQLLLEAGADPNAKNKLGFTALHAVCRRYVAANMLDIIKLLLDSNADVNSITQDSWTAVGLLANGGRYPSALAALLEAGAQCVTGAGENTPLQVAARHDISGGQMIETLLQHGANVNAIGGEYGSVLLAVLEWSDTPVWQTSESSGTKDDTQEEILQTLQVLLIYGVDVNMVPDGFKSPIVQAAVRDWPRVVTFLLRNGATIPAIEETEFPELGGPTRPGRGVLRVSILSYLMPNQYQVFELLLDAGVSPEADSIESLGMTMLSFSCTSTKPEWARTTRLLLQRGADRNRADPQGWVPLQRAAFAGSQDHVHTLLEFGALPYVQHPRYGTLLHSLCKGYGARQMHTVSKDDFTQMFQLLKPHLENDAFWRKDEHNRNCLHYLAQLSRETLVVVSRRQKSYLSESRAVEMIKPCLEFYGRPDMVSRSPRQIVKWILEEDQDGETAFFTAAKKGDVHVIALLVDHIKSLFRNESDSEFKEYAIASLQYHRDKNGWNALHHAAAQGRVFSSARLMAISDKKLATQLTPSGESASELAEKNHHYDLGDYIRLASATPGPGLEGADKVAEMFNKAASSKQTLGFSAENLLEALQEQRHRKGLGD